jgi:hypothetical protein
MDRKLELPNELPINLSIKDLKLVNENILKLHKTYINEKNVKDEVVVLRLLRECVSSVQKIEYLDRIGKKQLSLYILKQILKLLKVDESMILVTDEILDTTILMVEDSERKWYNVFSKQK